MHSYACRFPRRTESYHKSPSIRIHSLWGYLWFHVLILRAVPSTLKSPEGEKAGACESGSNGERSFNLASCLEVTQNHRHTFPLIPSPLSQVDR
ncbi:hypothetical protein ARMGADRAFT_328157 [Armillaria gallica]|uniref:Uncharacterized protein n=1 Tax=Armillaria gallica TaxID=47427 RepID=A0A2H3DDX1_ARMGA|nr:hypothetical protein ARMGADRAFT_328157 [Armillaria gallica]